MKLKSTDKALTGFVRDFVDTTYNLTRRKKLIYELTDLYKKSGIFFQIATYLRNKYKIPKLNFEEDFDYHIISEESGDIEIIKMDWFDHFEKKEALTKDVYLYLEELHLSRKFFSWFLHYLCYKEYPKYIPIYDIEIFVEFNLISNLNKLEKIDFNEFLGYTEKELKSLIDNYLLYAIDKVKKYLTAKQEDEKKRFIIMKKCKSELVEIRSYLYKKLLPKIKRVIRPFRNPEKIIEIIKSLKKYKKTIYDYDYASLKNRSYTNTSSAIIEDVYLKNKEGEIITVSKEVRLSSRYRKHVERIYKRFPFLKKLHK